MLKRTVRPFRTSDLVNLLLFNLVDSADEAITRDRLGQPPYPYAPLRQALWRSLNSRRQPCLWIGLEGRRVWGMASARMRSGQRAWEIHHLYLSSQAGESGVDLLEAVSAAVAAEGAERLFLRLPAQSPLVDDARRCGFLACVRETLFRRSADGTRPAADDSVSLRSRLPRDDFDLFRLYNATTPLNVRSACAVTLEQWRDAREPRRGSNMELVCETNEGLRGWISVAPRSPQAQIELLAHPEERDLTRPLAQAAMGIVGTSRDQLSLVPEYATNLHATLEELGFSPHGEFRLLIKATMADLKATGLAPATTA